MKAIVVCLLILLYFCRTTKPIQQLNKRLIVYTLFAFISSSVYTQELPIPVYPKGYFRYPLGIPIKLNANFGEMRPNHFHMGLDLFTQRKTNLPVYAPADGYIARIKIDPNGFGRALYINHPNGYTTLYAHMNTFTPEVEAYLVEQQYANEKWKIEVQVPANKFKVQKGQFIGNSGNTGASEGPHVHFEIRKTENDNCVNPLFFGFNIPDNIPPVLTRLAVYDRNKSTFEQFPAIFVFKKTGDTFKLASPLIKTMASKVSFAITAFDRVNGFTNSLGFNQALVYDNDKPVSGFLIDNIGYDMTRYLNAHIDYRIKTNGGAYLQHLSALPGNRLDIYKKWNKNGLVDLSDGEIHHITLLVKDSYGNTSKAAFNIQQSGTPVEASLPGELMKPNEVNVYENNELQVYISEKGLYDAIHFIYGKEPSAIGLSDVYVLQNPSIPLQDSMIVGIKATRKISGDDANHVLMYHTGKKKPDVARAYFKDGWFTAKFREFGTFQLVLDNEPPKITGNIFNGANLSKASFIKFIVSDNYKEIKNFRAELDGKWLLFGGTSNTFTYRMDSHCPPGEHELKVRVEDEAGNVTEQVYRFVR
ncbi:MAG: M23 family metallopeptidase [Sphingobacteriales bacterium]|nr:MAG: M23 family metallopeptidase [Sphingobacteriales bacterium]